MTTTFLPGTNPVLSRELRVALRNARAFAMISIYVALLGAVVIAQFPANQTIAIERNSGDKGRELFWLFVLVQAFLILVVLPSLSSGSISQERERQTLEPLLLSPMTPMQVVWGKAAGVLAQSSLLVLSTLPLTSLCFLLGGVSPAELFSAYAMLMGLALFTASIGLYCSARWNKTMQATIACYLMLPPLLMVVITVSFVGAPIVGVWAIVAGLGLLRKSLQALGTNKWIRKVGPLWILLTWALVIGLGIWIVYAIFTIKSAAYIALGVFAVLYLLFVTQLGLQQAAREIARAQVANVPMRVRVEDMHAEWQQALAPPSAPVRVQPPPPPSINSGFKVAASGGPVEPALAEDIPIAVTRPAPPPTFEPVATPARRQSPDSYGIKPFLSDKLNPVFAKDLRNGLLGKFEYLLRFTYIATIGTEVLLIMMALFFSGAGTGSSVSGDRDLFGLWAMAHLLFLLVAAGWLGARSIAPEHEQQTLEQLVTAPLTARDIVVGKTLAVMAYTLYVWAMGLPMVILLLMVGSIDWGRAAAFIAIEFVFSLLIASWGMYCSIRLVTVRRALGYTLGALFCVVTGSVLVQGNVALAIGTMFGPEWREIVALSTRGLATMLSPLSLLYHALFRPDASQAYSYSMYGGNRLYDYPLVPGALFMGGLATLLLFWLTMRAFVRYTDNI